MFNGASCIKSFIATFPHGASRIIIFSFLYLFKISSSNDFINRHLLDILKKKIIKNTKIKVKKINKIFSDTVIFN